MNIKEILIEKITEYENNPRNNDGAVEAVAESIKEFGFKVPVIVDADNVIVCGHTRVKAAKLLGLDKVPCIIADDLTEEQIKAFRLADNKVSELAGWNFAKLEEELAELSGIDMSLFGFDLSDFEEKENKYDIPAEEKGNLCDTFVAPPFSILDSRKGYWTKRKKEWRAKIKDNAEARAGAKVLENSMVDGFNEVSLLDPVLSELIVRWFMPTGEGKCYDVFAGDTVFGFVSSYLKKTFTGVELRKEQADFNNERVREYNLSAKYICDDGRNVLDHIEENSQDLLFSCPPYFDLEVYSEDPRDASNQSTYREFMSVLEEAFTKALKCLKENRFAVIVCGDIRDKNGAYYDFCGDIKKVFTENGLKFYNELILVNPAGTAALRANRNMKTRKVVKVHQNVLVFYKGDINSISKNFGEIELGDIGEWDYDSENE